MSRGRVVHAYLEAFCSGDVEALEPLLHEELVLTGPLYQFDSREAYLESLRADAERQRAEFVLMQLVEDEGGAAALYRYMKSDESLVIAQFFEFADDGRIRRTRLVFDTSSFE